MTRGMFAEGQTLEITATCLGSRHISTEGRTHHLFLGALAFDVSLLLSSHINMIASPFTVLKSMNNRPPLLAGNKNKNLFDHTNIPNHSPHARTKILPRPHQLWICADRALCPRHRLLGRSAKQLGRAALKSICDLGRLRTSIAETLDEMRA